jgi:hypothetical protein
MTICLTTIDPCELLLFDAKLETNQVYATFLLSAGCCAKDVELHSSPRRDPEILNRLQVLIYDAEDNTFNSGLGSL